MFYTWRAKLNWNVDGKWMVLIYYEADLLPTAELP